jgi:CRP-like cAMP-binding protein
VGVKWRNIKRKGGFQERACIINLEKDNTLNPVARLKAGDIVGEMAVLTGEGRSTHVDAETDMDLWSLTRQQFETLAQEYPEHWNFYENNFLWH